MIQPPFGAGLCTAWRAESDRVVQGGKGMKRLHLLTAVLAGFCWPPASDAVAQQHQMPENARVYILWPYDGAVIQGGFWVRMGLSEAGIAPAGIEKARTGHHHILVDA